MKKLAFALLMLPLAQGGTMAQTTGNPEAGKAYWERAAPRPTLCRQCHGEKGEGAFGPDLAGRGLDSGQFLRAVRQPWGIMPAFTTAQLSDQDGADLAAYFASLPKVAEPGKWRVEATATTPPGQAAIINIGCAQCHGGTFNGPRGDMGATDMSFDEFTNLVYNHTTAMPHLRTALGSAATNLAMGNYPRSRVSTDDLQKVYFWARDEIGFRPLLTGVLSKGEAGPSGVTYALTVANGGVQGKGMIAEGLTVSLAIPADNNVVAATGTGYQGVRVDEKTKTTTAVWVLPRSAPKDKELLTVTLAKATTQAANLRGDIRWAKPSPKTGPSTDNAVIAPAPL
jgi:mono/diheme cytochrome c family protein